MPQGQTECLMLTPRTYHRDSGNGDPREPFGISFIFKIIFKFRFLMISPKEIIPRLS